MTDQPFIDYVIAAERLLEDHYGLTLNDAGIELDELAAAQEEAPRRPSSWTGSRASTTLIRSIPAVHAGRDAATQSPPLPDRREGTSHPRATAVPRPSA